MSSYTQDLSKGFAHHPSVKAGSKRRMLLFSMEDETSPTEAQGSPFLLKESVQSTAVQEQRDPGKTIFENRAHSGAPPTYPGETFGSRALPSSSSCSERILPSDFYPSIGSKSLAFQQEKPFASWASPPQVHQEGFEEKIKDCSSQSPDLNVYSAFKISPSPGLESKVFLQSDFTQNRLYPENFPAFPAAVENYKAQTQQSAMEAAVRTSPFEGQRTPSQHSAAEAAVRTSPFEGQKAQSVDLELSGFQKGRFEPQPP